jgi:hypothetical protein
MADGSKLEGTLIRKDDFLVVFTLPDGTRKSIARNNGIPKVDVKDPKERPALSFAASIFEPVSPSSSKHGREIVARRLRWNACHH